MSVDKVVVKKCSCGLILKVFIEGDGTAYRLENCVYYKSSWKVWPRGTWGIESTYPNNYRSMAAYFSQIFSPRRDQEVKKVKCVSCGCYRIVSAFKTMVS